MSLLIPKKITTRASKKEVREFLTKLYKFYREGHKIRFHKMQDCHGYITFRRETEEASVTFDPRGELFATIIHEPIHYFYPDWSETQVRIKEAEIVNALTNRQIKNVLKRFSEAL